MYDVYIAPLQWAFYIHCPSILSNARFSILPPNIVRYFLLYQSRENSEAARHLQAVSNASVGQ